MKIIPSIFLVFSMAFTTLAIAEDANKSSLIDQQVSLMTSDGKNRTISGCNEFIQLRQNDLLIERIEVEPDSAYNEARVALVNCNLNWQSSSNKLSKKEIAIGDISKFFEHLPANVVLAISKDENGERDNSSFKSLRPDLKRDGNSMLSEKSKERYILYQIISRLLVLITAKLRWLPLVLP